MDQDTTRRGACASDVRSGAYVVRVLEPRSARGKQDQREGVQQRQKDNVKTGKGAEHNEEQRQRGGWRVRDNRSWQEEGHELDRTKDLEDAEEKFNKP